MTLLDREYGKLSGSWKSYLGSLGLTGLLFFAIASTRFAFDLFEPDEEPELSQYYLPPPPAPTPKPLTLPSRLAEAVDFRVLDEEEDPADEEEEEKIKLEFLDVTFAREEDTPFKIDFDLKAKLRAVKPTVSNRLIIYERDQVDEKPVRIFAPSISMDRELRRQGAELVVLYRVKQDGRTADILVLDSTNEEADEHARKIIKGSRFRPAQKDEEPVSVWVQHLMIFREDEHFSPFSL